MSIRNIAAAGLIAGFFLPIGVAAQTAPTPSSKAPEAGAPPNKMSDADKAAWAQCKSMTKEAMMKDATCGRLLKAYPHAGKGTKPEGAKPSPQPK